jgi:hypothetical protein
VLMRVASVFVIVVRFGVFRRRSFVRLNCV